MIGTNLLRIGVVVATVLLGVTAPAAVLAIDRVDEDSTRVADTLPFAPADEDSVGWDETAAELPTVEADPPVRGPRTVGDLTMSLGYSAPQGTFTRYASTGFHALLRVSFPAQDKAPISFWFGFAFTHFSRQESTVYVEYTSHDYSYYGPAREVLEEDAFALHVGLQLGNPTRRAFFRPRASLGVGLYVFSTTVKYFEPDWPDDYELGGYTDQLLGRFGWRGVVGADFFFTPKWGLSLDLHYDHVLRLNLSEATESKNITARFQGIAVVTPD